MRPSKRANLISPQQEEAILRYLTTTRNPQRDRVLFLLSLKAGLGARDISALTWAIVATPHGSVNATLSLKNRRASGTSSRQIPIHPTLREALIDLYEKQKPNVKPDRPVIYSQRREGLSAQTVTLWFHRLYRTLGMDGYSAMSGRRTFITRAAQKVSEVGGNLCDVQHLAGHVNLAITQRYAEESHDVKWRLINLL